MSVITTVRIPELRDAEVRIGVDCYAENDEYYGEEFFIESVEFIEFTDSGDADDDWLLSLEWVQDIVETSVQANPCIRTQVYEAALNER